MSGASGRPDRAREWTALLAPLAPVFAAGVRLRNRGYERGWWRTTRLATPVMSVGNLALGGRGKTPAVIAIGGELLRRGVRFDVLTRGYRRQSSALAVARTGEEPVEVTGDEPLLIARQLGVPVLIAADRARAGAEGERRFGSRLHLLDDGLQHRQLRRDFDLAIVTAADFHGRLLPAGRLREPPAALARVQAVLWLADAPTSAEAERARATVAPWSDAPVFLAAKRVRAGREAGPRKPLAFCALADPESFWRTLAGMGAAPAARLAFRDHHRYGPEDVRRLRAAARAAGADGFVTTEKDLANLSAAARAELAPLQAVGIELEIERLPELVDQMLARAMGA